MKLILDFNDDLIRECEGRKSSPLLGICWEHDGLYFPDREWRDFGSVIVGWWLVSLRKLLDGSPRQDLRFMDGPHRLNVRLLGDGTIVRCRFDKLAAPYDLPIDLLVDNVQTAAGEIRERFALLNVAGSECKSLEAGLERISTPRQ